MDVTIGIPTIGRESLNLLLEKIRKYKDVEILLVYKGDLKTKEYNRAIEQKEGYYEEAMNIILKESHSSLLLITDDDAIPSNTWVEDHVNFHEKYEKIGVASGVIKGKKWKNYPNALFLKYKNTIYMEEYNYRFKDYVGFLTKVGLSVDRREHDPKVIEKTLAIAGVNMSIKKEVYNSIQIPEYSLRGSYNESIIAISGIKKGFDSAIFNKGEIIHEGEESLSRTNNNKLERYLAIEKYSFPYAVNLELNINFELLKEFSYLLDGEAKIGIDLAIKGMLERMEPHKFREELSKIYSKIFEQ
jgi:GT2 family glycosyltransferase